MVRVAEAAASLVITPNMAVVVVAAGAKAVEYRPAAVAGAPFMGPVVVAVGARMPRLRRTVGDNGANIPMAVAELVLLPPVMAGTVTITR